MGRGERELRLAHRTRIELVVEYEDTVAGVREVARRGNDGCHRQREQGKAQAN